MKLRIISLLILALSIFKTSLGDVYNPLRFYASPGFKIGFCLTSKGMYLGPELDIGVWRSFWGNPPIRNAGFNIGKTWTWVNNYGGKASHKQRYFGIMVESENYDVKLGYTSIRNGWGYNNVNECRVGGFYLDGSYTQPTYDFAWYGVNAVFYKRANWKWFDRPYLTLYTKYKYDFKRSELKDF